MARTPKPSGQKQKRGRSIASFQRRFGTREVAECTLIVCEGAKSEPLYFKDLRRRLRLTAVQVDVYGEECDSDPISVVEFAIKKKEERDRLSRSGTTQLPAYETVWCVCDCEASHHNPTLQAAIDKANSLNYMQLALSNPAFEYWYLLHFEFTTRPFMNADEVINALEKHLPAYQKNSSQFGHLFEQMDTAIENAKRVLAAHPEPSVSFPHPSTFVHELVESLKKAASSGR